MALTKPAQQFKCVARNVPITGTEHSAAFREQYNGRATLFIGQHFPLYRDNTNKHDRYAVQVRAEMGNPDSKLGWIGMKTGHSEKIGKLLDDLPEVYGSYIRVTERKQSRTGFNEFWGDVYLLDYDEPVKAPLPPPGSRARRVSHLTSPQGAHTPIDLTPYIGKVLLLATTTSRVSVTLQAANGDRLGWFRKSGLDDIEDWPVRRALVQDKGVIDIVYMRDVDAWAVVQEEAGSSRVAVNWAVQGEAAQVMVVGGRQAGKATWHLPDPSTISPQLDKWGKRHAVERNVRELLFIPKTLMLQTGDEQDIWFISEDGEHWLHLLDLPLNLKAMPDKLDIARRYAFDQFESHYPADFYLRHEKQQPTEVQPQKEITMTTNFAQKFTAVVNSNKNAATTAAYLEAGRIGTNQLAKLAGKHLPMMLRGYADTAVGKLVIANIAVIAAKQLRPNDETLNELTEAMQVAAFQEVYQSFDIEGFVDGLLESPEMKKAVAKLPKKTAAAD